MAGEEVVEGAAHPAPPGQAGGVLGRADGQGALQAEAHLGPVALRVGFASRPGAPPPPPGRRNPPAGRGWPGRGSAPPPPRRRPGSGRRGRSRTRRRTSPDRGWAAQGRGTAKRRPARSAGPAGRAPVPAATSGRRGRGRPGPGTTRAASATVRVRGPTVSSDGARGNTPVRGMRPWVTLRPTRPQRAAGTRTEPPVSVPIPTAARPPATAAAEPPEDPPGEVAGSQGLRTGPHQGFSLEKPKANSCRPVRPTMIAPAASRRRTTVAEAVRDHPVERRPAGGGEALLVDQVLQGHRHPGQGPRRPPRRRGGGRGRRPRPGRARHRPG